MPGFSSEEIQAAVDRFLLKQVSVSRLPVTAARNVTAARDTVFDLLTTTLLLRTDSVFYLIWLAKNRLRKLLSLQIESMTAIDAWAEGVSRPSKLVNSTTDLTNAQAAIANVNAGLNARTTGVRGSIGPAVDRFRSSVDRFVRSELTKNVVVDGVVTETAEELRALVAAEWAQVLERAADIDTAVANTNSALTSLAAVRLPESAVRDIVSRVSDRLTELQELMAGDSAVASSRSAMLDLLTMRTLLARAADFRNPLRVLMPLAGDGTTATLIDSDGTTASITGTVSGPFNHDSAVLDLSLNGGTSTPSITLPSTSRAELRSQPLTFPSGPGGGAEVAVVLNHTTTVTFVPAASYASGAAAASALDAALAGVDVSFDATTTQLVFTSADTGDASFVQLLADTAARAQVADWLVVGVTEAAPVPTADVVAAINGGDPDVEASFSETFYATFDGLRSAVGGEEAIIWDRRDFAANLVADGTTVVSSPVRNFEGIGVQPGWGLVITAPAPSAGTYGIVAVDGPNLTLDAAVAATGAATYYLGPDYSSVPAGARVRVTGFDSPTNNGFYRVASAAVAQIVTDIDLRAADTRLAVTVFTQFVTIAARGTTTSSGIGVLVGSAGATALGLAVAASESVAELGTLQISTGDFLQRGVRVGDVLVLTSPSTVVYTRTVVSATNTRLVFNAPVPVETGAWTFQIQSQRYLSYDTLQASTTTYAATTYAGTGITTLDTVVARLINGAKYTSLLSVPINKYIEDLTILRAALDAYAVSREIAIDNIVRTMREQGLDRATDLLLALDLDEFFTMDADGASYTTNLVRKAATAAREVTPVSKSAKSDRIVQEFRPVSFQPDPYDPLDEDRSDL